MAEQENDPFKEFGGKAINANKVSPPAVVQDETDPFAEFGGKSLKKKLSTVKSNTTSQPSSTSFGANSFGTDFLSNEKKQEVYSQLDAEEQAKEVMSNRLKQIDKAYQGDKKQIATAKNTPLERKDKLNADVELDRATKDADGNWLKYWYNKTLEGAGSLASGLAGQVQEIAASAQPRANDGLPRDRFQQAAPLTREQEQFVEGEVKDFRENVQPTIREYLKENIGASVDPRLEKKYDNNTFVGAIGGLANSLAPIAVTALSGGLGGASMYLQSRDNAIRSINATEEGRNLDEATKTLYGSGVALGTSLLEKYGFDKIFKGETRVISDLITKYAIKKLSSDGTKRITGNAIKDFLEKEVSNLSNNYIKKGAKALDGALVEYGTEFGQQAYENTAQLLTNKATGEPIFDTSNIDTWQGFLSSANQAGVAGAIGGGLLGTVASLTGGDGAKVRQNEAAITEIDRNLENEELSETARQVLMQKKVQLQGENEAIAKEIDKTYAKLDEKQQEQVNGIVEDKIKIEEAIADPNITPEVESTLEQQAETLDKELSEIKPVEQAKTKTDTEYFDVYKDAVDKSKTIDEAYTEVTKDGKVLSDTFVRKYNPDGSLSQEETFAKFYNEVKPNEVKDLEARIDKLENAETGLTFDEMSELSDAKTELAKIKPSNEVVAETEVITPTEEVKAVEEVKTTENEKIQSVPKNENVEKVEVPVKEEAKQVGVAKQFAIDEINKGNINWDGDRLSPRPELGVDWRDIRKGQADLLAGKDTVMAQRLVEAINKAKADGGYNFIQGGGKLTNKIFVPIDGDIKQATDLTKDELKYVAENETTLANEYDEWFNNLSEEEKSEELNSIENGNANKVNPEPKGTTNVRNQEDAGTSEKTDEKVKVGDPIRAFADKVRRGKINKLGGFKASTGFDGAWDLGLETIALTLDGGAKVADAIQAGLEAIKKTDWYKNLADKKDFDDKYSAHMEAEYESEAKEYKKTTGINQEKIDETRRDLGMEEIERLRKSDVELGKQAQKWIEDGNSIPDLLKRLEKGALPTDVENVVLRDYISSLEARNNKKPTAELMADINRATKLVTSSRSELGRALRAGVGEVEVVDNLSNFILDEMDAMGVETIPQDLIDELADKYAKGQEAKKAYEEGYEKAKQEAIEQQAQSELNKAKAKAKQRPNVKKTSSDYASERKEIVNSIREKLKKARSQANAVPVPYLAELIAISPDVAKLAKSYVEQGVSKLDDLVKKIKEDLQEDIPDITDTEVRDLIAGEYRTKRPTKSDILANVRELQTQARLLKQIEDLENGKIPTTDLGKIRRSKEIDELKKQIKDLEDETGVTDIRGNKARRTYIQNQIDKLKKDIALGNFEKEDAVPRKIKLDAETQKKQDEYIAFQKETWKRRDAAKYEQLSVPRKAWNKFQEFLGLRRLIQTSLDFSMPFRQAITVTINPRYFKTTLSSFENMFKSTFSEKKFDRIMFAIENDPLYKDMLDDKLIFSDVDSKDNLKRDEDFRTSFLYHIPYLREPFLASNRAAAGYINTARYELYLKGVERLRSQGISREQYPDHYKSMANWAMNLTGRGKLLEFMENSGQAQRVLGDTFYGARLMASRFNLLNPNTYVKMPKEVRVEALKDMASYASVAAVTLIAMSAMGASVSLDPDDPDFLKAKWGTKRYDFTTGGMSVYLRFFFKLAKATAMRLNPELYGENKNKTALKEANKYGAHALKNTMNFFRYKLAPNTGYVVSGVAGTDALGKDFDPTEALNFYPMYTEDMVDAFKKEEGATSTYQVLLPNIFGIGMQDYDNKKSGSKKTTSAEREKARQERRDKRERD